MPSLRARLVNSFLRLSVRRRWRPGLGIAEIRARVARTDALLARRPPDIAIEATTAGGVPAEWIGDARLAERGIVLYLHGGAWCLHLPNTYRKLMAQLSQLTGMRILLPDYRLAPEHPFPAGIDDCLAVYRWLVEQGHALRPLALAGDSAGGSLTLVTLMRAREAGLPMPRCAALLSPSTDLTMSGPSARYNAKADPMFSPAAVDLLQDLYCPGADRANPTISPLFGRWQGLPPLLFHAGSTEMLLDDSVRAHDRARQAGVDAGIEVFVGMPHVFQVFELIPESRPALTAIAEFIVARTTRAAIQAPPVEATSPGVPAGNTAGTRAPKHEGAWISRGPL